MSKKTNTKSTNLSIPVDAFEQFEANSMYEEEEYITLSDIVSPDPTAPQLPNDIGEIPYDNEVVLGVNDDPNSHSLPGLPGTTEAEQTVSTELNLSENNVNTEQPAENNVSSEQPAEVISDHNQQGRPKRIRKKKSYVEDFVDPDDIYYQPKNTSTTPNTKPKRGRKPKQNLAQNESTQPENGHDNSLEQLPKPIKRGRKKMSNLPASEASNITNPSENIPETSKSQPSETNDLNPPSETPDLNTTNGNTQVTRRKRRSNTTNQAALTETPNENKKAPRRKGKMKKTNIEENLDLELQIDTANKGAAELMSDSSLLDSTPKQTSKKGTGRRGRPRKTQIEIQETQIVNSNETQENPNGSTLEGTENSGTAIKKPGRRGRKKKAVLEEPIEPIDKCISSYAEEEDDMDNVSLQALSQKNGDKDVKTVDQDPSVQTSYKSEIPQPNESDEIDVGDDISLSQLKDTLDVANTEVQDMEFDETVDTLNSSDVQNESADTEACKIDSHVKEDLTEKEDDSLLQEQSVEDDSGRPKRRKARKVMHYDEGSDEDPFANVELSDDEHTGKKGRYYSDDEYVPGSENKKGTRVLASVTSEEDSDISEIDEDLGEFQKGKRKLFSSKGPQGKKGRKSIQDPTDVNVTTIAPKAIDEVDDIEVCLQSSVIQANENATKKPTSVYTNEFENFIAQKIQGTSLQIKKVSSEQSSQNAPLEIPVLDPDANKTLEVGVQTPIVKTTSSGVQTSIQHEIPMKDNVPLSTEQSEQACEFLKSIVKTTSELGQLMTEKSEDFITKKINTKHVTDTFKMDYCVKKSFLLLKLAKHNIVQMEDDLTKQYEEFLKRTNLISYREEEKTIEPKPKKEDSDSDCEIVEDAQTSSSGNAKQIKAKFNPKTVFLNKELSIKIAKKPAAKTVADKCKETLNIKNKHSVWISDTVMVKKIKPTQSFLAQDSRNKKPPDCFVTEKMVSDFFDTYYKKIAPSICAPFTTTMWLGASENYVCNYFTVQSDKISEPSTSFHEVGEIPLESNISDVITGNIVDETKSMSNVTETANPASLKTLCTAVLKRHFNSIEKDNHNFDLNQIQCPRTLFRLCLNAIIFTHNNTLTNPSNFSVELLHDDLNQIKETLEVEEDLMEEIDTRKRVNVLEETEGFMDDVELGKGDTVLEATDDLMGDVDVGKGVTVLEETEDLTDNEHLFKDYTLFDVDSNSIQNDDTKTDDALRKTCANVKETNILCDDKQMIMPTLQAFCFKKIKELLFNPLDMNERSIENDENMSENSFSMSETGSLDLSIRDCKIDDMIAELDSIVRNNVESLFSLCVKKIQISQKHYQKGYILNNQENTLRKHKYFVDNMSKTDTYIAEVLPNAFKSLKHLSFVTIKKCIFDNLDYYPDVCQETDVINTSSQNKVEVFSVKKLANICFEIIAANIANHSEDTDDFEKTAIGMTINCVNTVSEEVFHNMEEENMDDDDDDNGSFYEDDNYESEFNADEGQDEDNNWESQVQLQEFKPCLETHKQTSESQVTENSSLANVNCEPVEEEPVIARIKLEPVEEPTEAIIDSTVVKTEPLHHDEMTIIPESIRTKQECTEEADEGDGEERLTLTRQNSSSFDVDSFEEFVRRNKMMHPLDEPNDQTFDEGGQRIRRQHEPDMINEYDPLLNLLIPQTFEPSSVVNAKGVLMASSSDDENSNQKSKKKADRKGRGRPKKNDYKQQSKEAGPSKQNQEIASSKHNKEPSTAKGKAPPPPPLNVVAVLTRRMREKIRQEEKKVQSSDSESETVPVTKKKDKDVKENEKLKASKSKEKQDKPMEDEIQCSNVDSTEQIEQNDEGDKNFTGFSTVDQNDINSYQKYVKFVYDKILPKHSVITEQDTSQSKENTVTLPPCTSNEIDDDDNDRSNSPLINYDEPTEILECEPTMPIFDDDFQISKRRKKSKPKSKVVQNKEATKVQKSINVTEPVTNKVNYTDRNGWQCYPIDPNETKLYQNPAIILEKLPESFVQTYFEYQEIAYTKHEDKEVDRLINLNTLKRSSIKEAQKIKGRSKSTKDGPSDKRADSTRAATPTSDGCAELTASEDEGANVNDEEPPPVPSRHTNENVLAKDSLMNDSDSEDTKAKVKVEPDDGINEGPRPKSTKKLKGKPAHESQMPVKSEHPESLMLTADKMMNKELNLLHAPVLLNNVVSDKADKGPSPKNKSRRSLRGHASRDNVKNDEDSSSEEEKQWVSTKEKLLKRMGKKEDTTIADDAKRAKLVTEFIERRGGQPEVRKRAGRGRGRKRSARKMLEREKQMRVLSHELFGTPVDPNLMGTRHAQFSQSYFKGRRNIRKVIDKKSLARSTVIANMEEFERKCRLNQRQAQLRELLGCEEGVNVLVINDEVCLEYSFEEQCPLISVHPFFTKVMKAHQYEGVKFMWDACFETLEKVESGHPGGGCILAHCMGLGKTLQVLALLHTVLTHPRVGMQRVLVCCPLSTVLNWVDEIHKWIGPVTDQIKVFELSKLKKTYERAYQLEDWYSGGGIFIIGYELFRSLTTLDPEFDDIRPTIVNKIRTALLDPGPDIIICDEGHLLKNDCSVLAVAMSRVVTKRRIVLTGTPMQNNLREYYCMVNFVKPNLLGTYSEYSNRFENPIMNGQHRDSQEEDIKLMKQRTHILHKVLEGCLQRQEASVLYPYLPKKHEYTVFISLTKTQWDLYKHYVNNCSSKNNKQSVLKDFHILQKIWSHPQVLHNFQTKRRDETEAQAIKPEKLEDDLAHEDLTSEVLKGEDEKPSDVWWLQYLDGGSMLDSLECSNKFVVVFKILNECIALGDKVLIFSTSLFTMDALEYFLKKINKWSLGQEYYRLDGSVPAEVRQKWCREFNAEHNLNTKLFLISTRAGSLGLNMVAANRVIILDTSWNPAHDIQSIFRVYRFGQKKDCYIYRLVALGTMEQKMYERSVTKQAVACRVVDEQQIDRHYNMAELTELYKYDEMGLSVAGGVAVGVTDVALLRVARHPALHAVHEHDSLLRGSSEQQLPEHERAAAWMQFQQEHAHKQMQNQLVSSFSLHLPAPNSAINLQTYEQLINDPALQLPGKSEHNLLVPYQPQPPPPEPKKGKRGRKKVVVDVPVPVKDVTRQEDKDAIQEDMSRKIMNILLRNNFQNQQEPRAIAQLVSTVRKIVAYGYVPKGSFNNEVAMQIADVLLMKDPKPAAPIAAVTQEPSPLVEAPKPRRGRPRKGKNAVQEPEPPVESQPSTSKAAPKVYTPGRRRAAIDAEYSFKESVAEGDEEDEGTRDQGDEDWQNDDSGTEEIVPEAKPQKKTTAPVTVKAEPVNESDSILLSDDDEPGYIAPIKQATIKKTKTKESQEEVIPLHPSLLDNQNFVKIVAHTYLKGNPMLDEDAATLAAQYSTLKAKKEIEATGKLLTSGPIYDIAFKVLGIRILKKIHNGNPSVNSKLKPKTSETLQVKAEPTEEAKKPETKKPESKKPGTKKPESKKAGLRLKARGIGELTGTRASPSPAPAPAPAPAGPSVVPVGFINRTGDITPSVSPAAPAPQFAPEPEESILPDDDDVIASDHKPQLKSIFKKGAKPLILNSMMKVVPKNEPCDGPRPKIPKLVISAGKLLPAKGFKALSPKFVGIPKPAATPPAPTPAGNDTICLDSDEETITSEPTPKPKKRVALKSTAKQHSPAPAPTPGAPAPSPAPPAPVPVCLTAANGQFNNYNQQTQTQLQAMLNAQQAPFTNQYAYAQAPPPQPQAGAITLDNTQQANPMTFSNGKYVVVPASNINRLRSGVASANAGLPPVSQPYAVPQSQPYAVPQTSYQNIMPQTSYQNVTPQISYQNVTPQMSYQNVTPQMSYQNVTPQMSYQNVTPQMSYLVQPMPNVSQTPLLQNTNIPLLQPMARGQYRSDAPAPPPAPLAPTSAPESILPTSNKATPTPNKTVCKPGDILRITKTGQIEVLNRGGDDDISIVNDQPTPGPPPAPEPRKTRGRAARVAPSPTPPKIPEPPKPAPPAKTPRKTNKTYGRSRKVSVSSSSGSDSSRPSTPEASADPEDPLSIFQNVVHIKAPEDDSPRVSKTKPTIVGNTSITSSKSSGPVRISKSQSKPPSKPTTPAKSTQDDIMKHISKTDTILKKLDKTLTSTLKTPATKTQAKSSSITMTTIDLDDYVPSPNPTKPTAGPYKATSGANTSVLKPSSQSKPAPVVNKIVGKSKDIIISVTGRSSTLTTANSAAKSRVATVGKLSPTPSASKKRPAATEPTQQKKRAAPMSLKDFNIDDIDDIIELE